MNRPLLSMKDKIATPLAGLKGCFVAGGAITSIHTNKPINDFDVYAKSALARDEAIHWAYENGYWGVSASSRALTFVGKAGDNVQIMLFDTFETKEKIFEAFDFTCCMGAFDLDSQKFGLHKHFLLHCAQRFLAFNPGTRFPYASVGRVKKYEEKGFTIGRAEFYKILLACSAKPITSWTELKEQVGGVYGESIEIPEGTAFSMEAAYKALDSLKFTNQTCSYGSAEEAIACTSGREIPYFVHKDEGFISTGEQIYARLFEDSGWDRVNAKPINGRLVGMDEVYANGTFFKKVKRGADGYTSIYKPAFVYRMGEIAESGNPYLYAYDTIGQARTHHTGYGTRDNGDYAIIELRAEPEDIIFSPSQPRLKKCRVVAEHSVAAPAGEPVAETADIPF